MELTVDNLTASLYDSISDLSIHGSEFLVGLCSGKLDASHCDDILRIIAHSGVGNLIVIDSPLCLNTIIGIYRNLKFTKKVRFNSEFLFAHNELLLSVYKLF